jgi:hypothetical protein
MHCSFSLGCQCWWHLQTVLPDTPVLLFYTVPVLGAAVGCSLPCYAKNVCLVACAVHSLVLVLQLVRKVDGNELEA